MSYDLGVWHASRPITTEEADDIKQVMSWIDPDNNEPNREVDPWADPEVSYINTWKKTAEALKAEVKYTTDATAEPAADSSSETETE